MIHSPTLTMGHKLLTIPVILIIAAVWMILIATPMKRDCRKGFSSEKCCWKPLITVCFVPAGCIVFRREVLWDSHYIQYVEHTFACAMNTVSNEH